MGFTALDLNTKKFKKFGGFMIDNIIDYINNYIKQGLDMRLFVGCDSHHRRKHTIYALTIVLYDIGMRDGAHVLFLRLQEKKEKDIFTRLLNETLYCLDVAEFLENNIDLTYKPIFKRCDYSGNYPTKRIEVHLDVNPLEGNNKHNKSNDVYNTVMGLVSGYGYCVKSKPNSPASSCAADLLAK
jgi:predicted RNase H-related nuclease YkuK (DUF458 family)